MAEGTIRYWAAARAAAGVESEPFAAATLAEALAAAAARHGPELARVLTACSFLIDSDPVGKREHASVALRDGVVIEALPPFAGGAG
jgi:molybdopterin converting factor small subunit